MPLRKEEVVRPRAHFVNESIALVVDTGYAWVDFAKYASVRLLLWRYIGEDNWCS
jgi:hypothetical protein